MNTCLLTGALPDRIRQIPEPEPPGNRFRAPPNGITTTLPRRRRIYRPEPG